MAGYEQLRNSSVTGTWMNVINLFAPLLTQDDRVTVAQYVDDYAQVTLKANKRLFGPSPEWAATGVHQAAKAGVFSPADAQDRILRLAKQLPKCAPFALGLDGVDESMAEQFLLRGLANGTANEYDMLRWCDWWPDAKPSRSRL